jgi:FtsH-binding integral membrane protein
MSDAQEAAPTPQPRETHQAKRSNGPALTGFFSALSGLLVALIPLVYLAMNSPLHGPAPTLIFYSAWGLGVVGLVLGVTGMKKAASSGSGKGLAVAAVSLAVAVLVLSTVITVLVFLI